MKYDIYQVQTLFPVIDENKDVQYLATSHSLALAMAKEHNIQSFEKWYVGEPLKCYGGQVIGGVQE